MHPINEGDHTHLTHLRWRHQHVHPNASLRPPSGPAGGTPRPALRSSVALAGHKGCTVLPGSIILPSAWGTMGALFPWTGRAGADLPSGVFFFPPLSRAESSYLGRYALHPPTEGKDRRARGYRVFRAAAAQNLRISIVLVLVHLFLSRAQWPRIASLGQGSGVGAEAVLIAE